MGKILEQKTGKTSEKWKDSFLDARKNKIVKFMNKKRLDSSGLLNRIKTTEKICDAGCGDLSLLDQLKNLGYKNLYGFDIDESLINSSSENSLSKNEFSDVKIGSLSEIPFDDKIFDAVIIWGILHHIDPKEYKVVFDEVTRVLKPSGELFIVEPYPYFFWKAVGTILGFLGYLSLPKFKIYSRLLSAEYQLFKDFSNNRKNINRIISEKYHQVISKWHTGFWIFSGLRQ